MRHCDSRYAVCRWEYKYFPVCVCTSVTEIVCDLRLFTEIASGTVQFTRPYHILTALIKF